MTWDAFVPMKSGFFLGNTTIGDDEEAVHGHDAGRFGSVCPSHCECHNCSTKENPVELVSDNGFSDNEGLEHHSVENDSAEDSTKRFVSLLGKTAREKKKLQAKIEEASELYSMACNDYSVPMSDINDFWHLQKSLKEKLERMRPTGRQARNLFTMEELGPDMGDDAIEASFDLPELAERLQLLCEKGEPPYRARRSGFKRRWVFDFHAKLQSYCDKEWQPFRATHKFVQPEEKVTPKVNLRRKHRKGNAYAIRGLRQQAVASDLAMLKDFSGDLDAQFPTEGKPVHPALNAIHFSKGFFSWGWVDECNDEFDSLEVRSSLKELDVPQGGFDGMAWRAYEHFPDHSYVDPGESEWSESLDSVDYEDYDDSLDAEEEAWQAAFDDYDDYHEGDDDFLDPEEAAWQASLDAYHEGDEDYDEDDAHFFCPKEVWRRMEDDENYPTPHDLRMMELNRRGDFDALEEQFDREEDRRRKRRLLAQFAA